jgi:3-oxoacyl-[acyl-carrier protein] reductase
MQLQSRTVVITGAGRGIGRALALQFAGCGADIALLDLNQTDLDESRAQVEAKGVKARTYIVDVSKEDQVIRTFDQVLQDFGRFDGILRDALLVKAKDDVLSAKMSLAEWQAVINVNLTGVFLCGREGAERMIRAGNGGVIINISSISRHGNAGQSNYAAAKAGVAALAVVWAKELARYGIRAAAIAPGFTHTDILASMRPEVLEKVLAPVPLHRLGQPEEIAHTAQYIVENDFFTGRCIDIDGGLRL